MRSSAQRAKNPRTDGWSSSTSPARVPIWTPRKPAAQARSSSASARRSSCKGTAARPTRRVGASAIIAAMPSFTCAQNSAAGAGSDQSTSSGGSGDMTCMSTPTLSMYSTRRAADHACAGTVRTSTPLIHSRPAPSEVRNTGQRGSPRAVAKSGRPAGAAWVWKSMRIPRGPVKCSPSSSCGVARSSRPVTGRQSMVVPPLTLMTWPVTNPASGRPGKRPHPPRPPQPGRFSGISSVARGPPRAAGPAPRPRSAPGRAPGCGGSTAPPCSP